jgi:hypothetical protein
LRNCPEKFPIFLNTLYEDFFVSGKKQPDLTSIFVHELGHLLGVDHSCENNSIRTGMPDCKQLSSTSEYIPAVMFPVVRFSTNNVGEVKNALTKNDQGRMNCLYGADGAGKPTVSP